MTCKLCAKCLKPGENLERCQDPDCDNLIHPSCGKRIAESFEEGEWETSSSVKVMLNAKRNADNQLSLKKKKKLGNNSISSKLESLSLIWTEQISKDESIKSRQLSIKERKFSIIECKFQAKSEPEERKLGMLEQELTIKIEKLKAETEREWLHVDKEWLHVEKERLHMDQARLNLKSFSLK